MVQDMSFLEMPPKHVCEGCVFGNMHRFVFPKDGSIRATHKLQLMHNIVCESMHIVSLGSNKYFITFIDDFLHYGYIFLLHEKSEALEAFKMYKAEVKN